MKKSLWKIPPRIKAYEALGCVADGRVRLIKDGAKVDASSRNKTYAVLYDAKSNAIMANDNGSYWQGYLGYPSIAFLMVKSILSYDAECAESLRGIHWKKVNTEFKNDYDKTEEYCLDLAEKRGVTRETMKQEIDRLLKQIDDLNMRRLGKRMPPAKERRRTQEEFLETLSAMQFNSKKI